MTDMIEKLRAVAIFRAGVMHDRQMQTHSGPRAAMGDADPYKPQPDDVSGFITTRGRFLTREEAVPVAVAAKQLHERWLTAGRPLLSADINW